MIYAKTVAASRTKEGKKIATVECEFPRFILAELNTHRMFSRNSASSRAIPVKAQLGRVWNDPVIPIRWGKNKAGMQSEGELTGWRKFLARKVWVAASKVAVITTWSLGKLGLHKQWANRLIEPWAWHKVVITSTEWGNFFALRDHPAAQPEIQELAQRIMFALEDAAYMTLAEGEWHVPYYREGHWFPVSGGRIDEFGYTLEDARKISASCCAQVSYRKNDDTLEKAIVLYEKLVGREPKHASPFEHQATPISLRLRDRGWNQLGLTHQDRDGTLCSGNFKGWIQWRQLL